VRGSAILGGSADALPIRDELELLDYLTFQAKGDFREAHLRWNLAQFSSRFDVP